MHRPRIEPQPPPHIRPHLHIANIREQKYTVHLSDQMILTDRANECRICLQGQSEDDKLISPCKCIGSIQYVHERCLKIWIYRQLNRNVQTVRCQLCHEQIIYQLRIFWQIRDCQQVCNKIQDKCGAFMLLMFTFIICFGLTIYLVYELYGLFSQKYIDEKIMQITLIGIFVALFFGFTGGLAVCLVRKFGFMMIRKIEKLESRIKDKNREIEDGSTLVLCQQNRKIVPLPPSTDLQIQ